MHSERAVAAQRWDHAVRGARFGIWDLDVPAGRVHYPPEFKRLLGYEPTDEADATSVWRERVHPDDLPGMLSALGAYLEDRVADYTYEFRVRDAQGCWRWMFSRGQIVERDPQGRALRAVGTMTDMTDRREAEARRLEHERADAARRTRTQFLSRMSHELRTPLNAVLGFAQLLEAQIGDGDLASQRRYVSHIQEAGWHLLAMIEDVLDLSAIESGRLALHTAPAPLGPLVQAACDAQRASALKGDVALDVDGLLPDDRVVVDAHRLRQVLGHLVAHAVRTCRPGGRVAVGAVVERGGGWRVTVSDTGAGLDAAPADLLDPAALGLHLSRWLVQRMGGRLEIESEPGVGSTFRVVVPGAPA